jgi:hypothetical protein
VVVNADLVFDAAQNARVMLPAGGGQRVITNYPGFPVVSDLSKELPITRTMQAFVTVFPSSLGFTEKVVVTKKDPALAKEANKAGGAAPIQGTVLARTSKASWQHKGFFLFQPLSQPSPQPGSRVDTFNVAVELRGQFPSFFAGKSAPPAGGAQPAAEQVTPPSGEQKSPDGTRLIVVADSEMVNDEYVRVFPNNLSLLLNTVDYLAQDESLIAIRTKTQLRSLGQVKDSSRLIAMWGNLTGLPLVFIAFGVFHWRWRVASRRRKAQALVGSSGLSAPKTAQTSRRERL